MALTIKVNGVDRTADVDDDTPLLWVLRDVFGMMGTKFGCGMALCGACTVHLDGTLALDHNVAHVCGRRRNQRDPTPACAYLRTDPLGAGARLAETAASE